MNKIRREDSELAYGVDHASPYKTESGAWPVGPSKQKQSVVTAMTVCRAY